MNRIINGFLIILILLLVGNLSREKRVPKLDSRCIQTPKYSDEFDLPEGLVGYNNYENALSCAKKTNKPLAIYFSGFACVNCRRFEDVFLFTEEVKEKLNDYFVFVLLNVDDKTVLPIEDQATVTFMNRERTLKTIGSLGSHLQIIKTYSGTQPNLALVDTNGKQMALMHYDPDKEVLMNTLNDVIENLD